MDKQPRALAKKFSLINVFLILALVGCYTLIAKTTEDSSSMNIFFLYILVFLDFLALGFLNLYKDWKELVLLLTAPIILSAILGIFITTEISLGLLALAVTVSMGILVAGIGLGINYIASYDRTKS